MIKFLPLFLSPIFCFALQPKDSLKREYKTKHVIVIIVDGPRYSETWGDSAHKYIPNMVKLSKKGIISTNFYNDKFTYTSSGHTAILTGYEQELENKKGTELPNKPSYLQYYREKTQCDSYKVWLITSKDKLEILSNCKDSLYHNRYRPSVDCGNNGLGTGYRNDTITFNRCISVLEKDKPDLLFVNFREPDYSGHKKDWKGYLQGIRDTDSLVYLLYQYINSNKHYKDNTTFCITNDHGRHLDNVKEGFCEHGDDCRGCKHINLFISSPDLKRNYISNKRYIQTDITATIAELLHLNMPYSTGEIMWDYFKK